eukprot:423157_1
MSYLSLNCRKYSLCTHISTFVMLIATSQLTYRITNDINNINITTEQFDDNNSCDLFITLGGGKICTNYLYTSINHVFSSCHSHRLLIDTSSINDTATVIYAFKKLFLSFK